MIAKRIKPRTSGKTKAANVSGTLNYILGLEPGTPKDKVTLIGSFNCDIVSQEAPELLVNEITELADEATRSDNPCKHYVFSWATDEKPSNEQIHEAMRITMKQLELVSRNI
jgi:hypothetical protein